MCSQHLLKAGGLTVVGTFALSAGHTGMVRKELGLERMREVGMEEQVNKGPVLLCSW